MFQVHRQVFDAARLFIKKSGFIQSQSAVEYQTELVQDLQPIQCVVTSKWYFKNQVEGFEPYTQQGFQNLQH